MTTDQDLGLHCKITRRDLLHGAAAVGVAALTPGAAAAPSVYPPVYPPAGTGLRGSHKGSFETAHQLGRENRTDFGQAERSDGTDYDLIVVGGGVSGLAAAYFYRKEQADARILILDNHDDFGGHAKRNEFVVNGRHLIGYGGSQSIDTPSAYSKVSLGLLEELAIDLDGFHQAYDKNFYQHHGLTAGVYFDQATYGRDAFVPAGFLMDSHFISLADSPLTVEQAIQAMPISEQGRNQLMVACTTRGDSISEIDLTDVGEYLSSVSYATFLRERLGVTAPDVHALLQNAPAGFFGVGIDAIPALDAMLYGLPGFNHLGIPAGRWLARSAIRMLSDPYIYHFPDGNASVARLIVRSLIPDITRAISPSDVVQARFDYSRLDRPDHNVRIRLNSTAVQVANLKEGVDVAYVTGGKQHKVHARQCVLACYNMMIPYLCPELPADQKAALKSLVKIPLMYTNVALKNWRALKAAGVGFALTPSAFHQYLMVDFPVSIGGYQFPQSTEDPMILHFAMAATEPGLAPREQHRVGRARMLATAFSAIERDLRSTLAGLLGASGFDPAVDIAGITVNRWPHGYAYGYSSLFDPPYADGEAPHEIGRRRAGNIAIANSDAGALAYLDCAIDQGHRAVQELLALR